MSQRVFLATANEKGEVELPPSVVSSSLINPISGKAIADNILLPPAISNQAKEWGRNCLPIYLTSGSTLSGSPVFAAASTAQLVLGATYGLGVTGSKFATGTTVSTVGGTLGTLSAELSTAAEITTIKVNALAKGLPKEAQITLTSGANTQTFTLSAAAAEGATELTVTKVKPNFAYPINTACVGANTVTASTNATSTANALTMYVFKVMASAPVISNASTSQIPNSENGSTSPKFIGWSGFRKSSPLIGPSNNPQGSTGTHLVVEGNVTASATVKLNFTAGLIKGSTLTIPGVGAVEVSEVKSSTEIKLAEAVTVASGTVCSATTAFEANFRIEFDVWGGEFEVKMFCNGGYYWRPWIDGLPAWDSPKLVPNTASLQYVKVAGLGAGYHRVCLEMEYSTGYPQFYGIYHNPQNTVAPPSIPTPRMIWVGDSYAFGIGADYKARAFPITLARLLGITDVINRTSAGGTGFVTNSPTSFQGNYLSRIGDVKALIAESVAAKQPVVIVLQNSLNDGNPWPGNEGLVAPAIKAYVEALKTYVATLSATASVKIIVTSPLYMGTPNEGVEGVGKEAKTQCEALGIPYVNLLAVESNPAITVFNGTGNTTTPAENGNADIMRTGDGTHPSPNGHPTLAQVLAPAFATALNLQAAA